MGPGARPGRRRLTSRAVRGEARRRGAPPTYTQRVKRRLAAVLAFGLTLGVTGPARSVEPPGLTSPGQHTDSYYPSVGSPTVDVQSYALDLHWQPTTRTLEGEARLRLVPARDGSFRLDLSGRLRVATLTVHDGRSGTALRSTYRRAGHTLAVTAAGLIAGAPYAVTVGYRGRPGPAKAPSSRQDMSGLGWHTTRTGQVWAMQEPYGAFTWFPVNDHPSDKATYDVRLDVPRRWVGVSNGRMVSRSVSHEPDRHPLHQPRPDGVLPRHGRDRSLPALCADRPARPPPHLLAAA